MNVPADVFKWLQSVGIAKEGKKVQDNRIELAPETAESIKVGYLFAEVIRSACRSEPNYNDLVSNLQNLKEHQTPAIRLINWNLLSDTLKKMDMPIDPQTKNNILAGDAQSVSDLIKNIYDKYVMKQATKINKPLSIDLQSSSARKPLQESANILELTVVSLSKNLKLSPQHALNLFLDNNKYLAHLLVKGVKGSFQPILQFLHDIQSHVGFIVLNLFCNEQKDSVQFLFNVLKPGLISKDSSVAKNTLLIFKTFHQVYQQRKLDEKILREWLLADGINSFLYSIKRHEDLIELALETLLEFLNEEVFPYVAPTRNSLFTDNKQLLGLFEKFLNVLEPPHNINFQQSKELNEWSKFIIKSIDSMDKSMKIKCCTVSLTMWDLFTSYFQDNEKQLPSTLINNLKSLALENDESTSYEALLMLFNLMLKLGLQRNSYAPLLFKTLVSIFSFGGTDAKIKFIVDNFIVNFRELSSLPAGPLMNALLTNIQNKVSGPCLQLCQALVQMNRLTVLQTLQTVDILVKTIISDMTHSSFCLQILQSALESIEYDDEVEQFVLKSTKLGLSMVYAHEKTTRPIGHIQKEYQKHKDKLSKVYLEDAKLYFGIRNITNLIHTFLAKYTELHQKIKMFVMHTYVQVKKQFSKESKYLYNLLKDIDGEDEKVQESLRTIEAETDGYANDKNIDDNSHKRVKSMMNSMEASEVNLAALHPNIGLKTPNAESVQSQLEPGQLKPSKRALKEIENAKIRRDEMRLKSEERAERSKFDEQRTSKLTRGLLQQRSIQLGISSKKDLQVNCLFEWDTVKEDGISFINLVNVPADQDAYVESIQSFVRHYRKVWRFLFFKYSSSGLRNKDAAANFKAQEKINLAQINKMLRDYKVESIKKDEVQTLVRLVNEKYNRHSDLLNLTYLGFEQFIIQFCLYYYDKPEMGFYHSPPVRHLKQFIGQLKNVTQSRNGSIQLFENPENAYFQEGDVIKEFNRRLAENPKFILPEGYKKIKEVEVKFDYDLSESYDGFNGSYRTAIEVLNQITFSKLGFYLIEPKTHKIQTYRAKPVLFQGLMEKMKDYKQGYLRPRRAASTAQKSPSRFKQVQKNEFHPLVKFSLGIKLGLSSVNVRDKYIAQQVAYWMDDMLDSIQNGQLVVHNKAHKTIDNEATRKRRQQSEHQKQLVKDFQQKYHKRDINIKKKFAILQKQADIKRTQDLEKTKLRREKEKQAKKHKEEEYQKIREMLTKKKQEEQKSKQAVEQEQKQRKDKIKEEYKKQVEQYFQKKKAEVHNMQQEMKKKKQQEKERREQLEKETQEKQNKLYMNILKKDEEILNKVVDIKTVYTDVWQSAPVQKLLLKYDNQLKILFELLLKYEKSKISATNYNQISNNTLNLFMVKFRIVPFMVSKNTVSQIYRSFLKEDLQERKGVFGLDYPRFKETLFKVCIKAKEVLNGLVDKSIEAHNMEQLLSKKAQDGGNHYDIGDMSESPSKQSPVKKKQRNPQLINEYVFDPTDVKPATFEQLLAFLQLPLDKLSIQQRFRDALEAKSKPTSTLIKQLSSQSYT